MNSDMWDERYAGSDLVWGKGPNQFLPPAIEDLPAGSALDLACGEGRNAIWLANRGWEATGVDFSAVGIDKARTLAGDTEVDWIVADATAFTSDTRFDLVLVFYLHLPPDSLAAAFGRAVDALAPGGTVVAVGHALRNLSDGYGGPQVPEILWTTDQIGGLLDGLEVIELGERDRVVADVGETAIDVVAIARRR